MKNNVYVNLTEKSLSGEILSHNECLEILDVNKFETLNLLSAAFEVRKKYWEKDVTIHIINNIQNGHCSEDCNYCAQSKSSKAKIFSISKC